MPTYNNALTDQPANRLAFPSSIGPVPRNEYLGALADFLAKSYSPERTQQMQGISQLLGMPAVSRTLDMMSYGDPLTTGAGGLGGTTRVKPDVLEAAMTVAPLGKPATMATLQAARLARQAAMAGGRAGERYAERVVPQIMERGGLGAEMLQGMSQGTRRQIFVGENSKTWNKANAAKAIELEKAGVAPTDIWMATGTFRGPEGKLRQEISDKGSKITDDVFNQISQNQQFKGPISQALTHKELYQAYPQSSQIPSMMFADEVPSGNILRGKEGTFQVPQLSAGGPSTMAQRSVALHELQHAVQQKEGFARGGNINEFASGPMFDKTARDLTADLSQIVTGGVSAKPLEVLQGLKYTDPKDLEPILKKYGFKNMDEVKSFIYDENERRTPLGQYQRLAGEAEARATQARRNMTADERRAKFPYESYDVPINQLIVNK